MSEDEFELDSKREAREYADLAHQATERIRIKQENKDRKAQGLAPLRVPRRVKEKKKKVTGYHTDEAAEESGSEEEVNGAGRKRKREVEEDEPELEYEGRTFCFLTYF